MRKQTKWIALLILLLSLPALACGLLGGDDAESTAVPVEEGAAEVSEAEPEPTTLPPAETSIEETETEEEPATDEQPVDTENPPPLPESALEISNIDELPFDSYRLNMVFEFTSIATGGEEVTRGVKADFAFSSDPPATGIIIGFSGMEIGVAGEEIKMAQIDETTYMVVPEMGCVTTSGEDLFEDNPLISMVNPDDFMEDMGDVKFEGEETINGIPTLHYSFDEFSLDDTGADEIEEAEGHVYIAKEGEFLVRMVVDATGKMDFFDEGTPQDGDLHMEINLTDVDEQVVVAMPVECEGVPGGADSEYPMVEDASEIASFGGVLSYQTALTTEEVLAFYDDALTAEGWVKDEAGSFVGGGSALLIYARDGESISLTIAPDEESGGSAVVLFQESEE